MNIRVGTVQEAIELAARMPEFSNPYNLESPDTPPPELDQVLVAEDDGLAVGFRAGLRYSADTFVVWLAGVLPTYRRRGVAGALYRSQKDWLKSQGYRFIRTHVRNSNRVMLRILVDHGYQIVEVVRYGDVQRNKVVFIKNLHDEDAPMTATSLVVGLLRDLRQPADVTLRARLRDLTISWLRAKYSGAIIEGPTVAAIVDRAARRGHRYCLIMTPGTIVGHAWELGLVPTLERWARDQDIVVAGATTRREESGCHVVEPTLLIDVARFNGAEHGHAQQSDANHISVAAGVPVHGLPSEIADTLLDINPRNDEQAVALDAVFRNGLEGAVDGSVFDSPQAKFLTAVQRQIQHCRQGIFVWNFEDYDDVDAGSSSWRGPVSTLYSVAAGLKTNWILHARGFDEGTRLVYFDYSEQALNFKRLLHADWDGQDYPEFLRYLFRTIRPETAFYQLWGGCRPEDVGSDSLQTMWEREIVRWGGEGVIRDHWRRARHLRVEYVLCNVLENTSPLLAVMRDEPSSVIWWSNVFFTFYSNWFYRLNERRALYQTFVRGVTARNPGVLIYGVDYNNIPIKGVRAKEYSDAYFQVEDDCLEPRRVRD